MNYKKIKFIIALVSLLVYEMAMLLFGLDGVSFLKLVITGLVWVSFFTAFFEYPNNYKVLKKTIPQAAYIALLLLFLWNVFSVLRSLFNQDGPLTTILGNVAASLAILVPFVIIFSIYKLNIRVFQDYLIKVLKFGILIFVVLVAFYGRGLNSPQLLGLLVLLLPSVFLLTVLPFQTKKNRILVLVGVLLFFYVAYLFSSRTNMLRTVLLIGSLCSVYLYYKLKFKWILVLSCLLLLVPVVLLQQSYVSGNSAFEQYLAEDSENDLNTDTRTFLYMELFDDLIDNDKLLIGKGSNGTYYSEYFSYADINETNYRNNVEVGILGILLKGGLIAVLLNIIILVIAIFSAFFRSKNIYTVGLGYILLIHTILLFIENTIIYSSYNFFIWFVIGVCLSKQIRSMTNKQIILLLNPQKQYR